MTSWYPNPGMKLSECKNHDRSWHPETYQLVETNFEFTSHAGIYRVCGYKNGHLEPQYIESDSLRGDVTSFTDHDPYDKVADGGNFPKRIYCIAVIMSETMAETFQCSVGLSLDGMPADFGK